ncbi:SgcJ/EcaC family oxidoreductase [Sphingomonas sp. NSE70-1]|uniref:SgcJ/EcaC family oxidoreductase n=1 Tax=Sphingomonas caseinilyticus TaxID=2908205 RepID=A0ABT0RTV5_9SPHN|nr:SgcJ/EcaC family oxidoreductase [Sphingomonas caseinilyticus]MCL6698457.1 SgcJ/EcaC family oxidoreductase [Sphingomonas caseinilyticus]
MTIRLMLLTATALLISSCDTGKENANGASSDAVASATSTADEEAIRRQVARWLELIKSKDSAAIAQIYTEDGAVMPPNATIGKGRAAIQQTWASMMNTPGFELTFAPEQIVLSGSSDMALDRGTYRLTIAPSGKVQSDTGKYVVVWRKVDGEWKAVADIFNSDLPAAGD